MFVPIPIARGTNEVWLTMDTRLPPRATGPIIDWKAFTEPVYVLFVGGIFFVLWNVYFTFYYVSSA